MKTIEIKLYEWPKEKPKESKRYGVFTKNYIGVADWNYSVKHEAWNCRDFETEEQAKDNLNDQLIYWFDIPIMAES